jgi:hypothetical protein
MNHIKIRKNGGVILIEPLEKGYEELKTGDEYVYLGYNNDVLPWRSMVADFSHFFDNKIGKVIWDYGVDERERVVKKFDESEHAKRINYMHIIHKSIVQ